jgi:hypothetical protein
MLLFLIEAFVFRMSLFLFLFVVYTPLSARYYLTNSIGLFLLNQKLKVDFLC